MAWMLKLFAALAVGLAAPGGEDTPRLTRDRLSAEQLEAMVAGPLAKVDAGDLAAGERAFETLLARAPEDQAGDLLTAFGVGLFSRGQWVAAGELEQEDVTGETLLRAAIPYLQRAIAATARRFGPDHPETALALNSYADARWIAEGDDPDPSVDRALAEALRIRRATLGPANSETLDAQMRLAALKSLPSRAGRDPARLAEASALFEGVIAIRAGAPAEHAFSSAAAARRGLAELYVVNAMPEKAVAMALEAGAAGNGEWDCDAVDLRTYVQGLLEDNGYLKEAASIPSPPRSEEERCGLILLESLLGE